MYKREINERGNRNKCRCFHTKETSFDDKEHDANLCSLHLLKIVEKWWKVADSTVVRDKTEVPLEPPSLLCKFSSEWKEHSKSSLKKGCNYPGASRLFSALQKNNGLSLLYTLFLNYITSEAGGSRGLITCGQQCNSDLSSKTQVKLCPISLL